LWVQSPAAHVSNFSTSDCKKINQAPSVRVIVICSDHRLLWRDSYKGVECALTPDESILHKVIIIAHHFSKNYTIVIFFKCVKCWIMKWHFFLYLKTAPQNGVFASILPILLFYSNTSWGTRQTLPTFSDLISSKHHSSHKLSSKQILMWEMNTKCFGLYQKYTKNGK